MIDTGVAVTFIRVQRSLVHERMIEPEGTKQLPLTDTTGHPIRVYGTTNFEVDLDLLNTKEEMIVRQRSDGVNGRILGGDYLLNRRLR